MDAFSNSEIHECAACEVPEPRLQFAVYAMLPTDEHEALRACAAEDIRTVEDEVRFFIVQALRARGKLGGTPAAAVTSGLDISKLTATARYSYPTMNLFRSHALASGIDSQPFATDGHDRTVSQ